jgi:ABC-2 type transport system ATP-binding protein
MHDIHGGMCKFYPERMLIDINFNNYGVNPMHTVEVTHLSKRFGDVQAVVDVSFSVERGEIFGLLGPNGAGKTTTIRMMLDIFKPDRGEVSILGGPMTEAKKDQIGYMPEDRGLYQDIQLERCLLYLASLKNVSGNEAKESLTKYLERFDLLAHKTKKVKELSKGMQQKAQIIATLLHEPELVIIDEPFTALDPINTQLVKDVMTELREAGHTIIMCTHQMHQVEELCDRILLIDDGSNVLYGNLEEIRRMYSGNAVTVRIIGDLPSLSGVESTLPENGALKLTLLPETNPQDVLKQLLEKQTLVEQFEIAYPTLNEIFIEAVSTPAGSSTKQAG